MREFTKKKDEDSIWTVVILILLVLFAFYIIGTQWIKFDDRRGVELNRTNQMIFENGTSYGVYRLAYEQTQSGNIYYLNETGGLEYDSLKNICGRIGK